MSNQDAFATWLRRQRKAHDLTREGLAQLAHCSASTVRRLEAGDLRPSKTLAESLAAVLGIPPTEREAFVQFARGRTHQWPSSSPFILHPSAFIPTNLPAPVTTLVGRKQEIAAVCELLTEAGVRLLTLTGPPGVGKTRLSLAAAGRLAETAAFPDGVHFVPLAPITEPLHVATTIAHLLGIHESPPPVGVPAGRDEPPEPPLHGALKAYLRSKRILLVLDNFEQVTAAAPYLTTWLTAAPGLKLLVTSRELLHLHGEHEFPVPPLALPDIGRLPTTLANAFYAQYPALQLFRERARAVQNDFRLTADNVADVARICAWLDGLPLAIEMAAAQVKWLPPDQLFQQLSDRLATLTGGPRDLTPRQQSLSGAIAWSYNLLDDAERHLFNLMGVFVGDCDLPAIQTILEELTSNPQIPNPKSQSPISNLQSPNPPIPVSPSSPKSNIQNLKLLLHSLVEKSLLRYQPTATGGRYTMLETIRDYAREQLDLSGLLAAARQAHAHYYFRLAQTSLPHLQVGGDQALWLNRLEQEYNQLRAALVWATETAGQAGFALSLADLLYNLWYIRGQLSEGRCWLETVLGLDPTPTKERATALDRVGSITRLQGDYQTAQAFHQQALALHQQFGDDASICRSQESLAIIAGTQGDYQRAGDILEEVLLIRRRLNEPSTMLSTLSNLAIVAGRLGNFDRAVQLYQECARLSRSMDNHKALSHALHGLGLVHTKLGNHAAALPPLQEGLQIRQELGDRPALTHSLVAIGTLFYHLGNGRDAVYFIAAATKLEEEIGIPTSPANEAERNETLALLRDQLGPEAFAHSWAEGRAMTIAQAVALAL